MFATRIFKKGVKKIAILYFIKNFVFIIISINMHNFQKMIPLTYEKKKFLEIINLLVLAVPRLHSSHSNGMKLFPEWWKKLGWENNRVTIIRHQIYIIPITLDRSIKKNLREAISRKYVFDC